MPAQPKLDTLSRLHELLKAIPHHRWATPRELQGQLAALGFEVDVRSVQRDLKELQNSFPLEHNDKGRPHGWRWSAEAAGGIASMGAAEALMLVLVQRHLQEALPASMLEGFEPLFARARQRLDRLGPRAGARKWPEKVAAVPPGLRTTAPRCDPAIQKALADALLSERQIDAVYSAASVGRAKAYRLHPLGLVLRGQVTYLVATTGRGKTPLLFATHRFEKVESRLEPVSHPAGFDLEAALAAGRDQFRNQPQSSHEFVLEFSCKPTLASLIAESPLGADQEVASEADGLRRARVTVRDSWELRWWLLGHCDDLEVLSPAWLRRDIGTALQEASAKYRHAR